MAYLYFDARVRSELAHDGSGDSDTLPAEIGSAS
jgi:hypothetical protein